MSQEKNFAFEVYPRREVEIVLGEGAILWDSQGNQYIDCTAGIGVANIGHGNPTVADALALQSRKLITCPGIFYNDIRGKLMEKLVNITPSNLNQVFLCNSGTEAVEAALKFARIATGKSGFISAMRGFHGRTMGSLSATYKYRDEFEPLIPGHRFVPFNNFEKLAQAVDDDTAAILLELVQGEGGVRPAQKSYMESVQKLCNEKHLLLIIDEIQTGFGRTGKMFACDHMAVKPDLMALAKSIAGGVPMGAVMCNQKIPASLGKHGSTFGGNPLACAAALATISVIEDDNLAETANAKGPYFAERLKKNLPDVVREVRQIGLMIGIELKIKARPIIESLMKKHVLALPAGPTVVRLLPPLVISYEQLDTVADAILESLNQA